MGAGDRGDALRVEDECWGDEWVNKVMQNKTVHLRIIWHKKAISTSQSAPTPPDVIDLTYEVLRDTDETGYREL